MNRCPECGSADVTRINFMGYQGHVIACRCKCGYEWHVSPRACMRKPADKVLP